MCSIEQKAGLCMDHGVSSWQEDNNGQLVACLHAYMEWPTAMTSAGTISLCE